uniref:Uncharacterized protein n=1 Tax=Bacteriophage sp. TaxID=38018 RepID=A0A8D9PEW1_9VIRU|nr:MAG TPA: hypothetical protein [Bacteriophage sp.]
MPYQGWGRSTEGLRGVRIPHGARLNCLEYYKQDGKLLMI